MRAKAAVAAPLESRQAGIQFVGIATRLVAFSEIQIVPGSLKPRESGQEVSVELQLGVTIAKHIEAASPTAEVIVDAKMTPDASYQPYNVRVQVSGLFRATAAASAAELEEFCRKAAPVLVWPYLRALVSSTTADARFGPVRLNPINFAAFLRDDSWKAPVASKAKRAP